MSISLFFKNLLFSSIYSVCFYFKYSSQNNVVMLISFQRRLHFLSTVIMLHFLFFLYKTIVFIYEKQLINISLFLIIIIIPYLKKREVNKLTSLFRIVLKFNSTCFLCLLWRVWYRDRLLPKTLSCRGNVLSSNNRVRRTSALS